MRIPSWLWNSGPAFTLTGLHGGSLLRAIQSLYNQSESCVRILSTKLNTFSVNVGLRQGCPLSSILFVIFMDRISRCSRGRRLSSLGTSELHHCYSGNLL